MKYGQQKKSDGIVCYSANLINLCVDVFNEEIQNGTLYHMYTREPVPFSSLFQAMKRMNALYDELQFPQVLTEFRSFLVDRGAKKHPAKETAGEPECREKAFREMEMLDQMLGHRGAKATFFIHVLHRQHSSWQGEVIWVDKQKKEYFRSALELVRLLDSALDSDGKKDTDQEHGRRGKKAVE